MSDEKPLMLSSMERMTVRQALEGFEEGINASERMSDDGRRRVLQRIRGVIAKLEGMDD